MLWMVPIYSVTSWFSLVFPRLVPRSYLNIIFLTLSGPPSSVNHLISRLICWYKACCTVNDIFNFFLRQSKCFLRLLSTESSSSFYACCFSLLFSSQFSLSYDAVFAAVRDCYEAYAVYTFIALLIAILVDGQGLSHLIDKVS